ncbi:hypothetical protein Strop_0034 [Salinispora tropica CNB-440]|uniref:Uncharacterized protein n=2 Tax=Salinispora tropica TaxID=168695 RepID=A4X0W9_SALTO|nr:hypothetical protein Strop_0034 [Salinispora tropica CNB-440]
MVNQPAVRRHSFRIAYAFGLLAFIGAATVLTVVLRQPALSTTQLSTPVPAPEITVVEENAPASGPTARAPGSHTSEDLRRSLYWSGIFGLTISLAGLGLVGTRRRRW